MVRGGGADATRMQNKHMEGEEVDRGEKYMPFKGTKAQERVEVGTDKRTRTT